MANLRRKKAVVLLSGGLDSSTCLAIARHDGFEVYALSVDYGQRHRGEISRARRICKELGAAHHQVVRVGLSAFGGSALTDGRLAVPKGRSARQMGSGIPITYVPARNTVFLALGLAFAEATGAAAIYLGVNALDYSGYPDCRPEFVHAFEQLARVATKVGVEGNPPEIRAPLLRLRKADIIRLGTRLGVPYGLTSSCYDPTGGRACGQCDACTLRRKGFEDAGIPDPTVYQHHPRRQDSWARSTRSTRARAPKTSTRRSTR